MVFNKAHFSFLEFTTDDQFRAAFPCWEDPQHAHSGDDFCPVEWYFWTAMAIGNADLALAEDDDDMEEEERLRQYPTASHLPVKSA